MLSMLRRSPCFVVSALALAGCGGSDDDDAREESPREDAGGSSDEDASVDESADDQPDAGPPAMVCVGLPDECSKDLEEAGCTAIRGCVWNQDCAGVNYDCSSQSNVANCTALAGCEWDGVDTCDGESLLCRHFEEDEPGCLAQGGCDWEEECGGKPEPCDSFSEADCELQPGCYLVRDTGF